jgi:hypothetical protein
MNVLHYPGRTQVGTIRRPVETGAAMQRALEEHRTCRREIQRLTLENCRLATELEYVRALNADLRASAEIWIRLYEAQLVRTKRVEGRPHDLACADRG